MHGSCQIPYFLSFPYDLEGESFSVIERIIISFFIVNSTILFAIGFSFYIIPERLYGQTIGKRIFGIHVMDISSIRIGWKQAIIRNIAKYNTEFLPVEFILGWLIKKKGNPIQKATDILAETRVVKYM